MNMTNPDNETDQKLSAIETAEELRSDLVAIAESDLPFAEDAEQILEELRERQAEIDN